MGETRAERTPAAAPPPRALAIVSASSRPIAIVDDDRSVRRALSRLLKADGFASVGFASAEEFLASASPHDFHCLLLDVDLGAISGPELCAQLPRSDGHLAVIFLTGSANGAAIAQVLAGKALAILAKPVDADRLHEAILAAGQSRCGAVTVAGRASGG